MTPERNGVTVRYFPGRLALLVTAVAIALVVPAWWIQLTWLRYAYVIVVLAAYLATARQLSRR
jgi:hypothetical protein